MTGETKSASTGDGERVKSVGTLFSILKRLKANDGMGVSDLAREVEMSKGAVHRYLQTLVDEGYAVNDDGSYRLAMRFLEYGAYVRNQYPYNEYIQPKVQQLAEKTGERAQYIIEEHGRGIYLHREHGENAVHTDARLGKVVYLHTTAAGKAILAHLSEDRVDQILDEHGLVTKTNQTIAVRENLFEELAEIRDRGYALNDEEHVRGLMAVGVPIINTEGDVLGALSVSGPANRIRDRIEDETILRMLLGTKDEIEVNVSYS